MKSKEWQTSLNFSPGYYWTLILSKALHSENWKLLQFNLYIFACYIHQTDNFYILIDHFRISKAKSHRKVEMAHSQSEKVMSIVYILNG